MWSLRLLVLAVSLFVCGSGLIFVSGYRADLGDEYNLAARIGGLMAYASVAALLLAALCSLAASVRWMARRHRHQRLPGVSANPR